MGAEAVYLGEDVSAYAQERERRLRRALAGAADRARDLPGGDGDPTGRPRARGGGDHYRVFTPYWRRWREQPRRDILPAPERIELPDGFE